MKHRSSQLGLGVLVLVLAASPAIAEEKIFHFKNGRHIQVEVIEESATSYVVMVPGVGRSTFGKDTVEKVESVPNQAKPFLAPRPVAPPPKPDPKSEKPVTDPAPTTTKPIVPVAPLAPLDRSPLATAAEMAAGKKALLAVPPLTESDPERSAAERKRALAAIAASTPLATLIAIMSEPQDSGAAPPIERVLALELVQASPADKARPLLARALTATDPAQGRTDQLFAAIERVGDDPPGTFEAALIAKVGEGIAKLMVPNPYAILLEKLGTRRCLPAIFGYLMEEDQLGTESAFCRACQAIIAREADPDAALAPLAARVNFMKFEYTQLEKLPYVFDVFGASRGALAEKLRQGLDALDVMVRPADPAEFETLRTHCVASLLRALGNIGTREATRNLFHIIEQNRSEERNIAAILALGHAKGSGEGVNVELVADLVDRMADDGRSPAEISAFVTTLSALTHQAIGPNIGVWRNYVRGLQR